MNFSHAAMPKITNTKTPAILGVSHWNGYSATERRQLFDWMVERATRLGVPPNNAGASNLKGYRRFSDVRQKIEDELDELRHFEVAHILDGSTNEIVDVDFAGWVSCRVRDDHYWEAGVQMTPSTLGIAENEVIDHCMEFAAIGIRHYGYVFIMAREDGPRLVVGGVTYEEKHCRTSEEISNLGFWNLYKQKHRQHHLLRDVYPISFLSKPYLDQPVYGTTLAGWIRQDESRGSLQPLAGNEQIAVWRPIVENIPRIREELFPSGVLFYYKFFQNWEANNPWKRDFSKPFVPAGPTPEIFRAEFFAGRDPKVTR